MKCPYCGQLDPGVDVCFACGRRLPVGASQAAPQVGPQPAAGDPPLLPPGQLLRGRYEITAERPKVGGMGTVYFAIDRQAEGKACVVKQPKSKVTSDAVLQQLKGEAQRMATLSRAIGGRLPEILEDFVEDSWYYVVQQRVPGRTLEEIYDEKHPREEKEVVGWAVQCCRVLKTIHEHQIVHRDISPDNLMLTPVGDITFIDFGTLRELQRIITKGTSGVGKWGITPREQWAGKPVAQSDIFALGATSYILLTGFRPQPSDQLLKGIGPQPSDFSPTYPPIRTKNPSISAGLERILARALNPDVSQRYATADQMRVDLESLVGRGGGSQVHATMFCPKCGQPNEPHLVYCKFCEATLYAGVQQCPNVNCKTNKGSKRGIPANAKFCPSCGKATGAK